MDWDVVGKLMRHKAAGLMLLLLLSCVALTERGAWAADSVEVENGRMTARFRNTPLKDVARVVGEKTGVGIVIDDAIADKPVTVEVSNVPVDKGIETILEPFSTVVTYGRDRSMKSVFVLETGAPSAPGQAPQTPGVPGAGAPAQVPGRAAPRPGRTPQEVPPMALPTPAPEQPGTTGPTPGTPAPTEAPPQPPQPEGPVIESTPIPGQGQAQPPVPGAGGAPAEGAPAGQPQQAAPPAPTPEQPLPGPPQ